MTEKQCPKCGSKDYEISKRFVHEKWQDEYTFRCLRCGYKITSFGNFQAINKEVR